MAPLRVVVLADTHLPDDRAPARDLPPAAWAQLRRCDLILHAGDVLGPGTLRRLAEVAPTLAVLGNNDAALVGRLPETRHLQLAGVPVAMIHDSGPRRGRPARLRRWFPGARLVLFGHSHVPCNEEGLEGQVLFNPGSPTQRRSQPRCTVGTLLLDGGAILGRRIVPVGP